MYYSIILFIYYFIFFNNVNKIYIKEFEFFKSFLKINEQQKLKIKNNKVKYLFDQVIKYFIKDIETTFNFGKKKFDRQSSQFV